MRNVLDKSCRKNQNTFYVQYLSYENGAVYKLMSKNMVEPKVPQMMSQYGIYEFHPG